jgi:[histone H3]-N6,N6-dimethyl-lysine9 N-methyltransferase
VPLYPDENLLEGCDCTDNCRDKSKCACWRKTFEATSFENPDRFKTNVGYHGRRLYDRVSTGIFECNSRCKCDCRCTNRVVQNGISVRMELFKTVEKGWALRCLDDIPKGTFICIYAGNIMTENVSDKVGRKYGDEYFAALDFISCIKSSQDPDSSMMHSNDEMCDNSKRNYQRPKQYQRKYFDLDSENKNEREDEDNSDSLLTIKCNLELEKNKNKRNEEKRIIASILSNRFFTNKANRFYYMDYLEHSALYVMDAKFFGNIGRYFNHSCSPNIFVQNVFVDTYDLRFPWIAFFSQMSLKAGTELCWDYNYTVDSVEGRKLKCHCNSSTCRGRLL